MSAPEPAPRETMSLTGFVGQPWAETENEAPSETTDSAMAMIFFMSVNPPEAKAILERRMNAIRRVGIVGLGKMGLPMAQHLLAKGFNVSGCDPVDAARSSAAAAGATVLASPAEVARASDLVIVIVGFDEEVETAVFGKGGIAEAACPGLIVALGSTVAPQFSRNLASRLEKIGVTLLDIPSARGEAAAKAGKVLLFGGGDPAAFEACRPAFSAFASDIFHL